ncbi:MAG TPA: XdhC family protein [bacterium]|nr:XdhC family protein [bacterium]
MKDVLDRVERWLAEGRRVGLATVIGTERSAPRDPGAVLAVTEDLEVAGSVSGGCVEAAVIEETAEAIRTGRPRRVTYGISDEDAIAVGLSCGGIVHIFVERVPETGELFAAFARAVRENLPVALATAVTGPHAGAKMLVAPDRTLGGFGDPALDGEVTADARAMLERAQTGARRYGAGARERADVEVFINSFAPAPARYLFGATTHAAAVARIGKFLGYRVTVCDARAALATRARIPDADAVAVQWPDAFLSRAPVDRRSVICILTHDPKFDLPVLQVALTTSAGYIGVLGSRRTHEARRAALRAAGVSEDVLARVRAPIGLDIGARTAEEVAVAIAAEIIALRYERPLSERILPAEYRTPGATWPDWSDAAKRPPQPGEVGDAARP